MDPAPQLPWLGPRQRLAGQSIQKKLQAALAGNGVRALGWQCRQWG